MVTAVAYELLPTREDSELFYRMSEEAAEQYGAIGYLRIDFGRSGGEFWSTWFDIQPQLNTCNFKQVFDEMIDALRNDGREPPLASRRNLGAFCCANQGQDLGERGQGYMVRTLDYSCYFRCKPCLGDYDVYCFAYDNRYLLPVLANKQATAAVS